MTERDWQNNMQSLLSGAGMGCTIGIIIYAIMSIFIKSIKNPHIKKFMFNIGAFFAMAGGGAVIGGILGVSIGWMYRKVVNK